MNKHAYLFMMELEKYRKAIAISVSALGYNQLKKEQDDIVLNFIFWKRCIRSATNRFWLKSLLHLPTWGLLLKKGPPDL